MENLSLKDLKEQFESFYGIKDTKFEYLNTLVNDVFVVTTSKQKYALKIYHTPYRTRDQVQWEIDLVVHLVNKGVPVVKPHMGENGYIQTFSINGQKRIGVLSEWASGEKPKPSISTYTILGKTAAQIHKAADTFASVIDREQYDIHLLIDEQLQRMKKHFEEAKQWEKVSQLCERLKKLVIDQPLDQGICHMDLTLDNIHRIGDAIMVFDFDSAGKSWRALEPYGVLQFSEKYFNAWIDGYRSVRSFDKVNERAVFAFVIIGEIRNVTWKLGLAESSRGKPLITSSDLPEIVDEWLRWEDAKLRHR